jgi:hypothetical protein
VGEAVAEGSDASPAQSELVLLLELLVLDAGLGVLAGVAVLELLGVLDDVSEELLDVLEPLSLDVLAAVDDLDEPPRLSVL